MFTFFLQISSSIKNQTSGGQITAFLPLIKKWKSFFVISNLSIAKLRACQDLRKSRKSTHPSAQWISKSKYYQFITNGIIAGTNCKHALYTELWFFQWAAMWKLFLISSRWWRQKMNCFCCRQAWMNIEQGTTKPWQEPHGL